MTYCVAVAVEEGLVFVSDSRTNAGADQIGKHGKMEWFFGDGERFFVVLSAGNLATTQSVITSLKRDIKKGVRPSLATAADLDEGAEYLGLTSAEEQKKHRDPDSNFAPEASFIFGGQIRGQPPGIFLVYPEGNYVRASQEAPYLQIGETKYGKPILDRIIRTDTDILDALKCTLVSMDSTLHSNATVGPPIDTMVYRADTLSKGWHEVLEENHPYLVKIREGWTEQINAAFQALPKLHEISDSGGTVTSIDR